MTVQELRAELSFSQNLAIISDSSYSRPTKAWLLGDFWRWFKYARTSLGLMSYSRANDCDNFSRSYCTYASDCHVLSKDPSDSEGLAVGEFYYHSARGPHAIVLAFTEAGRTFIEPQTGQEIFLTPQEISTCFFVHF